MATNKYLYKYTELVPSHNGGVNLAGTDCVRLWKIFGSCLLLLPAGIDIDSRTLFWSIMTALMSSNCAVAMVLSDLM